MDKPTLGGSCPCGAVTVEVTLTSDPSSYTPRACDCDYCRKHDAAYISDPNGSAVVTVSANSALKFEQQGDKLAEFLVCAACGQLVGVRRQERGVINIRVLSDAESFASQMPASPKQLGAEQKIARWSKVWFAEFVVVMNDR